MATQQSKCSSAPHTHLRDAWEKGLDVDVGVVDLQIVISETPCDPDGRHDARLCSHTQSNVPVIVSGCVAVPEKSTLKGLLHVERVLSDNNKNVK